MEGFECVCIWKGSSVLAWGDGGFVYGRGGVCVHGDMEGVYMEGMECVYMEEVECAWMRRGRMRVYGWF